MDSSILFVLVLALALGVGFGMIVRQRSWPWLPLLIVAPLVSAVGVCLLIYVWTIIFYALNQQWRNDYPIYLQALGSTLLLAPGILLYGLIPTLLGYLVSQLRF